MRLGRDFGWLWAAFAISPLGTWLAFDAFPLLAILVLHAGPAEVSALAAIGLAVGAALAAPLGPWVELRRKRPVMIAMDVTRFAALMSVPAAFALGWLSFAQLLVVSVIVAAADIAFRAASGACLKALVAPEHLLVANARLESTMWTATAVLQHGRGRRPDHGHRTADGGAHARRARVRAVAVRARVRRALRRRAHRRADVGPARRAVRAHAGDADLRRAAVVLVVRPGLRRPGRARAPARDRGPARPGHVHGRVQPDLRDLPARAHRGRPHRAHAVGVDGHEQGDRRGDDRAVGTARRAHDPARGDRARRRPHAVQSAPAPAARSHAGRLVT